MNILFVKTSSLGDVIQHCPAVSDAAREVPGARIDWLVEETFAGVAAMHASVRRVIPVAMRRWRSALWSPSAWAEMFAFRRALARERYDAVIDSQALLKSALVSRLAAGTIHGMDRASAREPLAARFYDVTHDVPKNLHAVERNRRLAARSLGYAAQSLPDYGLRASGASSFSEESPYALFLTMTSRAAKLWPEAHWIELGRALGMRVLLPWGSAAERARAECIAAGIAQARVLPQMKLEELAKLFADAKTVVGLDTGLTHLAAALGAPTVGIYCGSDPACNGLYGCSKAINVGTDGRAPSVAEVLRELA